MVTTLEMEFIDSNGKDKSIMVQNPRGDISPEAVKSVMRFIISKQIFLANKATLVDIRSIKLHKVEALA